MPGYSAAAEASAPAVLLRPEEAARLLRLSRTAVYELLGSGELGSVTIGRRRRIPRRSLDDYVAHLVALAADHAAAGSG